MNRFYFLCFVTCVAFSQGRTEDVLPKIESAPIGQITSAKGWLKNQYRKWVSKQNTVPFDLENEYKSLENYEAYALGTDNFIQYDLRGITIKDSTFLLLTKRYNDGFYTYETIREGWNKQKSFVYYVIDRDAIKQPIEVTNEKELILSIPCLFSYRIPTFYSASTNVNLEIAKDIRNELKDAYGFGRIKKEIYVMIRIFKSKNIAQFMISETLENFSEKMYYETDLLNFSKFIKINVQ